MERAEAASLEASGHDPVPAAPPLTACRRPFGRGRPVSLFTLGTMRALAAPECMEIALRAAIAAGINHLETAPAYGPAESFLGQALVKLEQGDPAARASLVITSKVLPGADGPHGREQLVACLRRLGVERLDNLAVHGLNTPEHLAWATHGPGAELLAWAMGEGMVGQVGFSSHGETALIEAALASGRFSFCSLHLHLFDQERMALARTALAEGLGVMAISPADKGGRLYAPSAELQADCSPFHPLELAYRFLLAEGVSTLTLGAADPGDLAWARRLATAGGPLGPRGAGGPATTDGRGPGPAGEGSLRAMPAVPAVPQRGTDPVPAAAAQPGGGPWHDGLRIRALQPDRPGRPLVGTEGCQRLRELRRLPAPLSPPSAHPHPAGRYPSPPGGEPAAAAVGLGLPTPGRRQGYAPL